MSLFFPDAESLRQFIPNSFSVQPGKTSLFDKLEPFLISSELWFHRQFIPRGICVSIIHESVSHDSPLYFIPRRIIACDALRAALPSLDIVITPNGIGTVESNNIKGAAAHRVDRLMSQLTADRDRAIVDLVPLLEDIGGWGATEQADWFRRSLFRSPVGLNLDTDRLWDAFIDIRPRLAAIEHSIAGRWISIDVLDILRTTRLDAEAREVASLIRDAVALTLSGADYNHLTQVRQASDIVRNSERLAPFFARSTTARYFDLPEYRNTKKSTSYVL